MARKSLLLTLCSGLVLAGCGDTQTISQQDPPPVLECRAGEVARNGACYCQTDRACGLGEYCDTATGRCAPRPVENLPDAGTVRTCISGARRCAPSPLKAIQECQNGEWTELEVCPPDGSCTASATGYYCSICSPGAQRCKGDHEMEMCSEKGDAWEASDCPTDPATNSPAQCVNNKCQVCTPSTVRCSDDGTSLETCQQDGGGWITQYCFPTGRCDAATSACVPPFCQPGTRQCKDATTVSVCAQDGSKFEDRDCRTIDEHSTQAATCKSNDCFDPCGDAARNSSYQGCEYWATTTSNQVLDSVFKGNASDGTQPTNTSEYALAIANPNSTTANVRITRLRNGSEQQSPSNPAANAQGRIPIAPGQLQIIRLPWQTVVSTGKQAQAFHVTSDLPVTAYQFNPVVGYVGSFLRTYSYSNDASLLLPAHILGKSYVVAGQEHITMARLFGGGSVPYPAFFSVIGTEQNTQVTIRFAASTLPTPANGTGGIAAQAKNSTRTYTLNKYEVLQFWTTVDGTAEQCLPSGLGSQGYGDICRYRSDVTGSIVTADKPVAVFAGADCTFKPFNKLACDHIEEQMTPFETWGKSYVGVRSPPYKASNGTPISNPAPDHWRVVAGCGKADCPAGTKFTINPAPRSIIQSGFCSGNTCTLPPVDTASGVPTAAWLEFTHDRDFLVTADQPIILAQYFTGSDANPGSEEGDPALVLTPPIEQWRTSYTVATSNTYKSNYLLLVTQSTSPNIQIDGKVLNAINYPGVSSANITGGFTVYRVPVPGKTLTITSNSRLGVVVAGFDEYVSYGYTGGLDLLKITQINPGG